MENQKLTGYINVTKTFLLINIFLMCVFFVSGQTQIEQDQAGKAITKQVDPNISKQLLQPVQRLVIPQNLKLIQTIEVPPLIGRNYDFNEIATFLDRIGLKLGRVLPIVNNKNVGLVITENPTAGTRVNPQTAINLTYGIEAAPEVVIVPQYIGLTLERAVGRMPNDRLSPGNIREVNSNEPPGIVINQFPEADMQVDPGTEVALDISIGPSEIIMVAVPRLIGFSL
ncbi:MAG: PASTA domain-containing protein, partial [Draconibacterium sp.]|nr:PASTA domain-containing protein [Draconibacterium sp.]